MQFLNGVWAKIYCTEADKSSKKLLNGVPEIITAVLLQIFIGFLLVLFFRTLIEKLADTVV